MVRKALQPFYTAYALIIFITGFFLLLPFFIIRSIWNDITARKAIYLSVRYWAQSWLWLVGMRLTRIGPKPAPGRYIIVANHISYLDTVAVFAALPAYFRALGKKEFSKIPLLGFLYRQIVIMVDRSSPDSRAISMRLMWRVLKNESDILIFPEGTFNETGAPLKEFYNGAFRLALTTGIPILPVVFPDTVSRWHYSAWWKLWPGKNRVIFLEPVPVSGMALDTLPALREKIYTQMQDALINYRKSR